MLEDLISRANYAIACSGQRNEVEAISDFLEEAVWLANDLKTEVTYNMLLKYMDGPSGEIH